MLKKFLIPYVVLFLLTVAGLAAQSNELLDDFLSRPAADLGTSSYLILAAAGQISPDDTLEDAADWLREKGLDGKLKDTNYDRPIRYGEFAYIMMEAFALKGGIMYSVFPGPRYAAREAAYRKWLLGSSVPGRTLEPFEVLNALMLQTEGEEL